MFTAETNLFSNLLSVALLSLPSVAGASEFHSTLPSPIEDQPLHQELIIGTELEHFDYKEDMPSQPGFKSEERGLISGYSLAYKSRSNNGSPFSFGTQLSYLSSSVFYDGALQSGDLFTSTSGLSILQCHITAGYRLVDTGSHQISLFTGIRGRHWRRHLNSIQKSPSPDLMEFYTRISLPIGLQWDYAWTPHFHIGLEPSLALPLLGEFELTFPGTYTSTGQSSSIMNRLKSGISYQVRAPVTYWLSSDLAVSIQPFFEMTPFRETFIGFLPTDTPGKLLGVTEPDSITYQYGSQFSLHLKL